MGLALQWLQAYLSTLWLRMVQHYTQLSFAKLATVQKVKRLSCLPKLNGQNKEYLLAQMKDIKSGARSNGMAAAMKAMVANVSEEEMAAIADYLSQVK